MITSRLTDSTGKLTPYGVQQTDRFAAQADWQPYPAALPFTNEETGLMTPTALIWMTQVSTAAGLPAPVSRGKQGFAILQALEGLV